MSSNPREAVETLDHCLEMIGDRMRVKKLRLNLDKKKVILVQECMMQVQDHQPCISSSGADHSLGLCLLLLDRQICRGGQAWLGPAMSG